MKFLVPLNLQSLYCAQLGEKGQPVTGQTRGPPGYRPPPTPHQLASGRRFSYPPQGILPRGRGGPWRGFALLPLLLVAAGLFLVLQNPYAVGGLFLCTLALTAGVVGSLERFLGLVVFIIYVGGAMVLFSYCFMLTPLQEGGEPLPLFPLPLVIVLGLGGPPFLSSLYDFYWVLALLLLVGVLLFVVIVRVVDVLDFGRGTIRVG